MSRCSRERPAERCDQAAIHARGRERDCKAIVQARVSRLPRPASRVRDAAARCGAGAEPITPALIEAAKKEGKVVFYTAMDLPVAEPWPRRSRRNSRHRGARSSAPAPSACSTASPRNTASNIHAVDVVNTRRPGALHHLEAQRLARALPAGGGRQVLTTRHTTIPTALHVTTRMLVSPVRLQHQPGEDGGRAEELCRPARSEMGRQDGQGPSRPTAAPS